MRKLLLGVTLAAAAAAAQAGGQASITCGNGFSGATPQLNVTYTPGVDAGNPGLLWLGVLSPNQTIGAVLDITNNWIAYEGGLYPPNKRFDGGIPGTVTISVPFPGNQYGTPTNTSQYVGYSVYMGHGIYTKTAADMVASRRTFLNSIKAERQAQGTWRAEYNDDTQMMWSLVQKNMVDNNKYGSVLTIPFIDCAPQEGGGDA